MRHYMVMLRLHIGRYEKTSRILVQAENSEDAGVYAQFAELHNTGDNSYWDGETCWDDDMAYNVYETREVIGREVQCLKRFFNVHTYNRNDLLEAGYDDR